MILLAAAIFSTRPVLEMGLNDDWSYAFIANGFARTGHISYTGWAAPLLGLQAIWGGLLIRLFGFSFTLLRLSTFPFAAGAAWLIYRLARFVGLTHSLSVFGALAIALSPVFIPLADSFMTDVPALFFWLACFYCGLRATSERSIARSAGFLAAAAVLGFAGGTIRQVVWVAPFLVLPAVAWLRRRGRALILTSAGLWLAVAAAAAVCLRWYQAQPGHEPVPLESLAVILSGLVEPIRQTVLAALLATLPILLLFVTGWHRWRRAAAIPIAGCLAAASFLAVCLWWFEDDFLVGNLVTENGTMWENSEALGAKPVILTVPVLAAAGIAVCLAAGMTIAWLYDAWRGRSEWRPALRPLLTFLLLTAPACAVYVLAVSVRYASDGLLFDRYMIFLTPPVAIAFLWFYQARIGPRPSLLACAALAVAALYGVANTHDYIAAARARLQAATGLLASGVPRDRISAGLEFDGWTQLQEAGRIPSYAERQRDSRKFPTADPFWFWYMTPAIHPAYFVVYSPVEGLRPSALPPISFRTWLPPFHRQVLIQAPPPDQR